MKNYLFISINNYSLCWSENEKNAAIKKENNLEFLFFLLAITLPLKLWRVINTKTTIQDELFQVQLWFPRERNHNNIKQDKTYNLKPIISVNKFIFGKLFLYMALSLTVDTYKFIYETSPLIFQRAPKTFWMFGYI